MPSTWDADDHRLIREQFPVLDQMVFGHPLVYLDNAATTQKPWAVLRAIQQYYQHDHSNVHRGVHELSIRATEAFDAARVSMQKFINARLSEEVIWTKGCTEAINLVAASWGRANLGPGDIVLLSESEHHANIVPWKIIADERGASIQPIPVDDQGRIDLDALQKLLQGPVKLVGVKHVCNAFGTRHPIEKIISMAHAHGAPVLIDGAQAPSHEPIDVQALDVDFYSLSGHKLYGPTGIGALYGKAEHLAKMPPYQAGGDMIRSVTFEEVTFADPPNRFEPGTPPISSVIGLGVALEQITEVWTYPAIQAHEHELTAYALERLGEVPGIKLYGPKEAGERAGIFAFELKGWDPRDLGEQLNFFGIAIRAGHHCCMPLHARFGVPITARASLALTSTKKEIDTFLAKLLDFSRQK